MHIIIRRAFRFDFARCMAAGLIAAAILTGCGESFPPGALGPGTNPDPGPGPGPDPDPDPVPSPDPDPPPSATEAAEVLTRLAPGVQIETIHDRYGTTTLEAVASQRVYLLGLPEGKTLEEVLPVMQTDPDLDGASPNSRLEAPEAQSRSTMAFADPALERVDREDQQAIRRIRAREAWPESRGSGVIVAVLDTGVDAGHPQLRRRIAPGGVDLVDDDMDPSDPADGIDSDGDGLVDEAAGHGTFIAGLVLAVAPDAEILPIRILDSDGTGEAIDIARGIEIAIRSGARIVNLSLGMELESLVLQQVIDEEARRRGIVFVASAGNRNTDERQWPAGQDDVIGVAAVDPNDQKADFSNFGSWVAVAAPGVGLVSTLPSIAMGTWSGTSFASGLASGEAAVLIAFAPSATSADIRGAMEDSGVFVGSGLARHGRIDVEAALRILEERLGLGDDLEIEILGIVASVDLLGRTIRLEDGTVIEVPNDGVIDGTGDLLSLTLVATAVTAGLEVRADGLALDVGGSLVATSIRFDLL